MVDRVDTRLPGIGRLMQVAAVGLLAIAASGLGSARAVAAFNHSVVETTFSVAPCTTVHRIAVAESTGHVYVSCTGSGGPVLKKFDLDGNPVNFTAVAPYVKGNELFDTPSSPTGTFGQGIAVDNSGANNGYIFNTMQQGGGDGVVDIYKPSGEWAAAIPHPANLAAGVGAEFNAVDVGPDGSIYTSQGAFGFVPHVTKYDSSFREVERLYTLRSGAVGVQADSTGAVWVGETPLHKFEQDQFTPDLSIGYRDRLNKELLASVEAQPSPFVENPLVSNWTGFDVDLSDDDLYVNRGDRIEVYSAGDAAESSHQNAPSFGAGGILSGSTAVTVTADHHVYASKAGGLIVRFGPGDPVPEVRTPRPAADDVGHTGALLRARVELAGGADVTKCELQYGKDKTYSGPESGVVPCSPDPAEAPPATNFSEDTDVSATLSGLNEGEPYHYRFRVANADGENTGIDRTVIPAFVLKVKTLAAADVTEHSATLQGTLDPDGLATSYRFEYGLDESYGLSTESVAQGSDPGEVVVGKELSELPAGRLFHYRLVASNANGTTYGTDQTFRTAAVPDVAGVRATEVAPASALLHARVDPLGYPTKYRFEYGTTPNYGSVVPAGEGEVAPGPEPVDVSQRIEGLQPGVTYHFRIVATNKWGSGVSPDTTFDFAPPSCPNDYVRQQTGASYLPDCRAYELVSPGFADTMQMFPSDIAWDTSDSQDIYGASDNWVLNTGLANSPSRFAFFAGMGSAPGIDAPNGERDMYMATRTSSGWVTTLPGLTGSQVTTGGRRQCSESMDLCIDHDEGIGNGIKPSETAPYLFTAAGESLGRLPTNLKVVPGGERFTGAQRVSGDFSHFLFSSTNLAYAPGGITGGQGSAYDNDLEARTVTIVSKLPNGNDIPQDGTAFRAVEFPGLSPDGSHVLMQTPAANGQTHLYMRVNQAITYDVARGAGVTLVGMSRDGSKTFFVAGQKLTADDHDAGADLYMWEEVGDTLTRISQGNGQGDSNDCTVSWASACGVAALSTERGHPDDLQSIPGLDDVMAEGSGDVYFYSPELLDPGRPAIRNQRNLYVFRNGAVQLVATLDPGTQVNRMQVSPDGRRAAFVTASRLTSYDSRGYKQMYAYDADSGDIRCASCSPDGRTPHFDVEASQGGPFMADDGRTFFATKEALVARDKNEQIIDVYEYVGGRPQLISSGTASRDFTGGGAVAEFAGVPEHTGLESVSANGTDVYFTTYDSLVPQDQNGPYVKFYNARTGGGFPVQTALAPCVAADECHGADSTAPAPALTATGGSLGPGGNHPAAKPAVKRKKANSKPKKRHKTKRHGKRQRGERRHG